MAAAACCHSSPRPASASTAGRACSTSALGVTPGDHGATGESRLAVCRHIPPSTLHAQFRPSLYIARM
jgi:hypothetical protein